MSAQPIFKTVPVAWVMGPDGGEETRIYAERSFRVEIEDEGAGEYITLTVQSDDEPKIAIDYTEWPELRRLINRVAKIIAARERK